MIKDSTEWERLVTLSKGILLNAIVANAVPLGDDLYQIGPSAYCIVDDPDVARDHLTVVSLLWACSASAARRAYYNDIEADDLVQRSPPDHVFPGIKDGSAYVDILRGLKGLGVNGLMEHASYRIVTDGKFVHKSIEFDKAIYYFRSPDIDDKNPPYAILWKMK
ncbi:hypothetical protein HQ393_06990 [Chitinibacter bivalviorum]|uniref:Uncharacterized protein n=1 Tax=Chitinibacter bivalviorum TaxID=2739434 RepID=A0A7H9BHD3_9NEIS|nr:hypothetical protein [Chitinibacter bivalviorum]QLG88025.1 hypothetical protein HQ393_06990 [Chitinibacter bivalviorum]